VSAGAGGDEAPDGGAVSLRSPAAWPMPNPASTELPNPQSYAVGPSGAVVTDEVTQLEWQREVDTEIRTWADATSYCEQLALDGGGFRLPMRLELLSLVDYTSEAPAIEAEAFPGTPTRYFWTSSRHVDEDSVVWVVGFGSGPGLVSASDVGSYFPTRCVRDADGTEGEFVLMGDVALDSATGLTWQRDTVTAAYDWASAVDYCVALELDGGGGWRLPSIKELLTLVDDRHAKPALNPRVFRGTATGHYWTSTTVAGTTEQARAVSFRFGADAMFDLDVEHAVRCVR
jgi:hypothetical protein